MLIAALPLPPARPLDLDRHIRSTAIGAGEPPVLLTLSVEVPDASVVSLR